MTLLPRLNFILGMAVELALGVVLGWALVQAVMWLLQPARQKPAGLIGFAQRPPAELI